MLDARKQDVITFTPMGVLATRLSTHTRLALGLKGPAVPQGLDLYCSDFCGCSKDSSPCEHYQLFLAGWKEGAAQAEQVYAQRDLDRDFGSWPCCWFHIQASSSQLSLGLGLARWSGSQTARRSVPTIYQRMAANRRGPATHQRGMSRDQRRNLV